MAMITDVVGLKSAFEKCEHITEVASMMECAIYELFICIASFEFQTNPTNFFQFDKELKARVGKATKESIKRCLKNLEVVEPHQVHCYIRCLGEFF
jgi:hypothetical protein